MKSGCLLSLVIVVFAIGGAQLGLAVYQYFPSSDYFGSAYQSSPQGLNLWYYGIVVAMSGGCVLVAAGIAGFVYNCVESLDWLRFIVGITCFIGSGLGIAATVLVALTLNSLINGGPAGISSFCYGSYCRLEFFNGAIVALSGLGAILAICFGLTSIMTT